MSREAATISLEEHVAREALVARLDRECYPLGRKMSLVDTKDLRTLIAEYRLAQELLRRAAIAAVHEREGAQETERQVTPECHHLAGISLARESASLGNNNITIEIDCQEEKSNNGPSERDIALVKRMAARYRDADIRRILPDPDGFYCMSQAYNVAMAEWRRRESSIPAPDPAEAMRAKLRPLAKQALTEEMDVETRDGADYEYAYNEMVRQVRAALKGNGEGR